MTQILPGQIVGVMGGGQLGRMFAIAARRMGYRVHTLCPEEDSPTGQLADKVVVADYANEDEVRRFARGVDVLTFEFENIPSDSIDLCSEYTIVRPHGDILHTTQNRLREKTFLAQHGLPLPKWREILDADDLREALEYTGRPAVLKSADFGYDGKGQRKITAADDPAHVWQECGLFTAVVEAWVTYELEISVIVARRANGEVRTFPTCENHHQNHILDLTIVPARVPEAVSRRASEIAVAVAEQLNLTGVLAVEMFLLPDGELLINELAPRPHNSGHFSFDACITSQFEQQLRAVCDLPLGSTELLRPCAMANLLGDIWENGEPDWAAAAALPEVKLHLYGKRAARAGRKMGHLVAFGSSTEEAVGRVQQARSCLSTSSTYNLP